MFTLSLATRLAQIMGATVITLALLALPLPGLKDAVQAEELPFDKTQTEAIQGIVRAYLLEHPEVIADITTKLQEREETMRQAMIQANLDKLRADLERDEKTPVLGNPNGDVTIVEFYDYRCGYCKLVYQQLVNLLREDGQIRLVLKDLPLLGPDSYAAAKVALAAHAQGKYVPFMEEGLAHRGFFDSGTLDTIAQRIGLDMVRFREDLNGVALDQQLERNRNLARALDLTGTPVFIVGDTVIPGALNDRKMKELVARARTRG